MFLKKQRLLTKMVIHGLIIAICAAGAAISVSAQQNMLFNPEPQKALYVYAYPAIMDTVFIGDLVDFDYDAVDPSSVMINGSIPATSVTVLDMHPDFTDRVLQVVFPARSFIESYGILFGESTQSYNVSGNFVAKQVFTFDGEVAFIGHLLGDVNGDQKVNLLDITYLLRYIYSGGPEPKPGREYGDVTQDGKINLLDVLKIIKIAY